MKYIGLIAAVVVAVAAAFMVLQMSQPEARPEPKVVEVTGQVENTIEEVNIYVAARDIPIGARIEPNMLTTRPWPAHLVVDGFVVGEDQGRNILQTITRASFKRDEPINKSKLVNPDDPNFLAGELPKGKRLVTMSTDEISGVAGFIFPGDRVDVLLTHRVLKEGLSQKDVTLGGSKSALEEEVTETLLYDVPVMAVDQRSTSGVDDRRGIIVPGSVSLAVSADEAQRLRLAEEVGRISFALRSVDDKDVIQTVAVTREKDLSQRSPSSEAVSDEEGAFDEPIRIIRGTKVEVLE